MALVQEAPIGAKSLHSAIGWKTVLVHVEAGEAAAPRLATAVDLARACDGQLIGVGAEALDSAAYSYDAGGAAAYAMLREQIDQDLSRAKDAFRQAAAAAKSEWRRFEERPAQALARLSRGADVIVAGGAPPARRDPYQRADAAELAILSGRPVLVAPEQGGSLRASAVVVAWKDTRESRRALADAMPVLLAAEEVAVVQVCAGTSEATAQAEAHTQEVAEHLKRHGINARAKVARGDDDAVADILNAEARALQADLIVAGCYGRSRMEEWLFGGATRSLLGAPERFLLISH